MPWGLGPSPHPHPSYDPTIDERNTSFAVRRKAAVDLENLSDSSGLYHNRFVTSLNAC